VGGTSPNAAWISLRAGMRALGEAHGLPVRMTEYAPAGGLLERGNHIFNELEYAGSATYHAQHVFTRGEHDPGESAREKEGGILYYVVDGGGLTEWGPTRYTGVSIGHWARFARPGSERIGVTSDDPDVRVQAFVDASEGRLAIVAINNAAESRRVELALSGIEAQGLIEGIQTAESDGPDRFWVEVDSVQVGGPRRLQFIAPARSVTSLAFGM
jgi:hypothetical protein